MAGSARLVLQARPTRQAGALARPTWVMLKRFAPCLASHTRHTITPCPPPIESAQQREGLTGPVAGSVDMAIHLPDPTDLGPLQRIATMPGSLTQALA